MDVRTDRHGAGDDACQPTVDRGAFGWLRTAMVVAAALLMAGCQAPLSKDVARGTAAYAMAPPVDPNSKPIEYSIGALDVIDVTVFQEPDLSLKAVKVDTGGEILMPLIGRVTVAGKTPTALAGEIAATLGQKYLVNPQVSVSVVTAVSQRVAVEGSVNEAGVYDLQGRTTLLEALALAKGTSRTASLNQVIIFRNIAGKRNAAVFNVSDIRRGAAPDPEVLGNDLVVVGFSNLKAGFRDFLSTAPLISIFRPF